MAETKSYRIWVAIGCRTGLCDKGNCICRGITLHDKYLLNFVKYLDRKYPSWQRMKVYDKKSGIELATFTTENRPTSQRID